MKIENRYLSTISDEINKGYQNFIAETQKNIDLRRSEYELAIKDSEDRIRKASFFGKVFVNFFRRDKIGGLWKKLGEIKKIEQNVQTKLKL